MIANAGCGFAILSVGMLVVRRIGGVWLRGEITQHDQMR